MKMILLRFSHKLVHGEYFDCKPSPLIATKHKKSENYDEDETS